MQLKDKHILITGGAKRIGRAIAESLLNDDCRLSIHYRHSEKEAKDFAALATKARRSCFLFKADLRDSAAIGAGVHAARNANGSVDILINSASLFYPTPALECDLAQWDELLETNLRGQFVFAQACAKHMKRGLIINIVDVYGSKGLARYAPYAASKGGLLNLTKTLAKEWAPDIRVNAISPGPVLFPVDYNPEQIKRSTEKTLLGRAGTKEDIVRAVRFIVENDYVTGIDLAVDGGRHLVL